MSSVYKSLFLVWLGHVIVDFFAGIWPVYKTMVGLDIAKAGMIAGLSGFLGDGLQLVFGFLGDRGYRKKLILMGVLCSSSVALIAYTDNYLLLFFFVFMLYIGSGSFHPAGAGMAQGLSKERKGLMMTIFASGGALGLGTSQLIFSEVYEYFHGHTLIFLIPVLAFCIVLYFHRFPSVGPISPLSKGFKTAFAPIMQRRKDFSLLYACQVFNQTVVFAFSFLLPDIMKSWGEAEWMCYGGAFLFYVLGGGLMMVPAGYLADKYGQKVVMFIASIASLALFYLFLAFGGIMSSPVLITLLIALGASLGVINPVIVSFGNRLVPDQASTVSAFLMGCAWCPAYVGPIAGGLLASFFVGDAAIKSMACIGVGLVASIVVIVFLPAFARARDPSKQSLVAG